MFYGIIATILIVYCLGYILGSLDSVGIQTPPLEIKEEQPKKKVGFALHPENIRKKPPIAKDDVGIVEYKTQQQLEEERDISKRQEEQEMTKSLSKHFPVKADE